MAAVSVWATTLGEADEARQLRQRAFEFAFESGDDVLVSRVALMIGWKYEGDHDLAENAAMLRRGDGPLAAREEPS